MKDRFDLPVTAASPAAIEEYVSAVDLLRLANPDADGRLEHALAAGPDFRARSARCLRAR